MTLVESKEYRDYVKKKDEEYSKTKNPYEGKYYEIEDKYGVNSFIQNL